MSLTLPRGEDVPIVWSIAGSDSSGGAGLQADLKTFTALGAHGCTVVTSVTAQSSCKVHGFQAVAPALLAQQIDALRHDMPPKVIKIGMLGDADGVRVLAKAVQEIGVPVIYDPVMVSSSGTALLDDATQQVMRDELLPCVYLLTPNRKEAEILSGVAIQTDGDVEQAAIAILRLGVRAVLIKSHESSGYNHDYYSDGTRSFWLTLPSYGGEVPRGTGCRLASAFAAALAFEYDDDDAAVIAKAYVHRCLRYNRKHGKGPPMASACAWPVDADDFPWLTMTAEAGRKRPHFPRCGEEPLGFYPVVDSFAWLQRILPLGVRTAQLRVKNLDGAKLDEEILMSVRLAQSLSVRLFVNDYWQLAIQHGGYGVHLGQEDLDSADIDAIQKAGLRLGISTHSYAEAARALSLNPSYIALGPVFPTVLKSMRFAPQGVETLRVWRELFTCPLVAIGGITLEKADAIYATGADSIAVVSDVTQNADPERRVQQWLQLTEMRKGTVSKGDRLAGFA